MRELVGRNRQGRLVTDKPKTPAPRKVPATRSQPGAKATNVQTLPLATVLADESSHLADGFWLIEWTASGKEKKPVIKSLAAGVPAMAVDLTSTVGRKVAFENLSETSLYSLVHMRSGQVPSYIFQKRSLQELGKWFDPPTLGDPKAKHLTYFAKKTKPPEPTADEKDDELLPNATWYVAMDVPEPEPDADDGASA
jgi:hypothetical protein